MKQFLYFKFNLVHFFNKSVICPLDNRTDVISISSLDLDCHWNTIDKSTLNQFFHAIMHGNIREVSVLLNKGVSPNCHDEDNRTPLHYAVSGIELNQKEIINLLISLGSIVNERDNNGSTPLHLAVLLKKEAAVNILLSNWAEIDQQDNRGNTPLHHAAYKNHTEIMELLLHQNANVNIEDKDGLTPFSHAAYLNHIGSMKLLQQYGTDKHQEKRKRRTAAQYWNSQEALNLLEEDGTVPPSSTRQSCVIL